MWNEGFLAQLICFWDVSERQHALLPGPAVMTSAKSTLGNTKGDPGTPLALSHPQSDLLWFSHVP